MTDVRDLIRQARALLVDLRASTSGSDELGLRANRMLRSLTDTLEETLRSNADLTAPDEEQGSSSGPGDASAPPSEYTQLSWWLDRLEDPAFWLGPADRGLLAHLVRNVLDGQVERARERLTVPAIEKALRNVETAARELDALFDGKTIRGKLRWTLDGRKLTEPAALALLSLHDYLNDVERWRRLEPAEDAAAIEGGRS